MNHKAQPLQPFLTPSMGPVAPIMTGVGAQPVGVVGAEYGKCMSQQAGMALFIVGPYWSWMEVTHAPIRAKADSIQSYLANNWIKLVQIWIVRSSCICYFFCLIHGGSWERSEASNLSRAKTMSSDPCCPTSRLAPRSSFCNNSSSGPADKADQLLNLYKGTVWVCLFESKVGFLLNTSPSFCVFCIPTLIVGENRKTLS